MDDSGVVLTEELIKDLLDKVSALYGAALRRAVRKMARFFRLWEERKKQAPPEYITAAGEEYEQRWREYTLTQLVDEERVRETVSHEMGIAGLAASALIYAAMPEVSKINRDYTLNVAEAVASKYGRKVTLPHKTLEELRVLYDSEVPPFSRMAYTRMGQDKQAMERMQREMHQAIVRRELPKDILKRLMRVTDMEYSAARRVAQTEGNRVMSEARYQACEEAAANGIIYINEWSARMVNTRESHAALNRTTRRQGETWVTIWGNELRFPGDPMAPAREVINCHCVLLPCKSVEGVD